MPAPLQRRPPRCSARRGRRRRSRAHSPGRPRRVARRPATSTSTTCSRLSPLEAPTSGSGPGPPARGGSPPAGRGRRARRGRRSPYFAMPRTDGIHRLVPVCRRGPRPTACPSSCISTSPSLGPGPKPTGSWREAFSTTSALTIEPPTPTAPGTATGTVTASARGSSEQVGPRRRRPADRAPAPTRSPYTSGWYGAALRASAAPCRAPS